MNSLEEESLERERLWLSSVEAEHVCGELRKLMNRAIDILHNDKNDNEEEGHALPILSGPDGDGNGAILKGFIAVKGQRLVKDTLSLYIPKWNRNAIYEANLSTENPMILDALQTAANHLIDAFDALDRVSNALERKPSLDQINEGIQSIAKYIHRARRCLTMPNIERFPNVARSAIPALNPPAPPTLVVEVSALEAHLRVSVSAFEVIFNHPTHSVGMEHSGDDMGADVVEGHNYVFEGKVVQLIRQINVDVECEPLQNALNALSQSFELCKRFEAKCSSVKMS